MTPNIAVSFQLKRGLAPIDGRLGWLGVWVAFFSLNVEADVVVRGAVGEAVWFDGGGVVARAAFPMVMVCVSLQELVCPVKL